MINTIYASQEHKSIIEVYINLCTEFAKEVGNPTRFQNFKDVLETILEYHNNYGKNKSEKNYYDWIMIIPINLSVMINGYFAGIETNKNRAVIRAYKLVLEEVLQQTVDKIDKMKTYE
jgi:CRISPR/Cas system CSM-associated protein Csm2 small subunit